MFQHEYSRTYNQKKAQEKNLRLHIFITQIQSKGLNTTEETNQDPVLQLLRSISSGGDNTLDGIDDLEKYLIVHLHINSNYSRSQLYAGNVKLK